MKRQIILASTSPRRREMMKLLNIPFKAVNPNYREVVKKNLSHEALVKFLALGKARAAAKKYPKAIIVSADTVVSFGGKIFNKPRSEKEAKEMLKCLSGSVHYVLSGCAVMDAATKQVMVACVKTKVYFRKLSDSEINTYIASGEAMDKAGAYGRQGKGFGLVKKFEGDFTANIGMPLGFVSNALHKLRVNV